MKKTLAFVAVLVLAAAVAVGLVACGKSDEIVGTWYFCSMTMGTETISVEDEGVDKNLMSLDVKKDGTFKMSVEMSSVSEDGNTAEETVTYEGTWKKQDGKYFCSMEMHDEKITDQELVLENDTLSIVIGEMDITFKK